MKLTMTAEEWELKSGAHHCAKQACNGLALWGGVEASCPCWSPETIQAWVAWQTSGGGSKENEVLCDKFYDALRENEGVFGVGMAVCPTALQCEAAERVFGKLGDALDRVKFQQEHSPMVQLRTYSRGPECRRCGTCTRLPGKEICMRCQADLYRLGLATPPVDQEGSRSGYPVESNGAAYDKLDPLPSFLPNINVKQGEMMGLAKTKSLETPDSLNGFTYASTDRNETPSEREERLALETDHWLERQDAAAAVMAEYGHMLKEMTHHPGMFFVHPKLEAAINEHADIYAIPYQPERMSLVDYLRRCRLNEEKAWWQESSPLDEDVE